MLKASALYIVLIISLIIAIISSSLLYIAFFYRLEYRKHLRFDKLSINLNSAAAVILSTDYPKDSTVRKEDLFAGGKDSVFLQKEQWGLFEVATVKAFELTDTLKQAFLIGSRTLNDEAVLYVSDEDRPISVSGTTQITGDAFLPKAGIKEAYVDGKSYTGGKPVKGAIKTSKLGLPELDSEIVEKIKRKLADHTKQISSLPDSGFNSFYNPTLVFRLGKRTSVIENCILKGKIIIIADTVLSVEKSARLEDILIFAPAIRVAEGFTGSCQFFATDSISFGKKIDFKYPTCAVLLKSDKNKNQPFIRLGENSTFAGIILSFEKERSELQTLINLEKNTTVTGEVFSKGLLKLHQNVKIFGKVTCNRFLVQTATSLYENYLIDVVLNRHKRSKYYLSGKIFKENKSGNSVLKWLN